MTKKKDDDEPCISCVIAVSAGNYLNVCRRVSGKKQCKVLMDDLVSERISPAKLFKEVRKRVKKGSKEEEELNEVDEFMKMEFKNAEKNKKKKKSR